MFITGDPSSSCGMIILRNNSHGGIIRVYMGIFTTALRNKKNTSSSQKNTSPYFHSVSFVIWPLTLMKRAHFSELFISRFSTYIRKQLAKMRPFHQSKRSDNKRYAVEVRWGIFLRIWRIILFLRAAVNIPVQTLVIPPWLLLRKMLISQLELGPPVCLSGN